MKKIIMVLLVVSAVLLAGCMPVMSPVAGGILTDAQWPGAVTSNVGSAKSGKGECVSILAMIGTGDCSVQTIAHNARITRIHHVDYHTFSILGIYGKLEVTVYGE